MRTVKVRVLPPQPNLPLKMMVSVAPAVFILIAYLYLEADSLFLRATQYPLREERVMARENRSDALDLGKNPFREDGLLGVGHSLTHFGYSSHRLANLSPHDPVWQLCLPA